MNKKVKILLGVLIVLIILCCFVLIRTLCICCNDNKRPSKCDREICFERNDERLAGFFLKNELKFNEEQMEFYHNANKQFQPVAHQIMKNIDSLKRESFVELKKEVVDNEKLNALSVEIGNQHAALKNAINSFYLEIKTICNSEQTEKLQDAFMPLFQRGKGMCNPPKGMQMKDKKCHKHCNKPGDKVGCKGDKDCESHKKGNCDSQKDCRSKKECCDKKGEHTPKE